MPDIPDSEFHTGRAGNFSRLQNEAANKRLAGYSLRKQLQQERDQLKQELEDKDRQIEEIDGLIIEKKMSQDDGGSNADVKDAHDINDDSSSLSSVPTDLSDLLIE